jgi:hypothetical protein
MPASCEVSGRDSVLDHKGGRVERNYLHRTILHFDDCVASVEVDSNDPVARMLCFDVVQQYCLQDSTVLPPTARASTSARFSGVKPASSACSSVVAICANTVDDPRTRAAMVKAAVRLLLFKNMIHRC